MLLHKRDYSVLNNIKSFVYNPKTSNFESWFCDDTFKSSIWTSVAWPAELVSLNFRTTSLYLWKSYFLFVAFAIGPGVVSVASIHV